MRWTAVPQDAAAADDAEKQQGQGQLQGQSQSQGQGQPQHEQQGGAGGANGTGSLTQGTRRWPFVAILLSLVLLGSSPWLYSRLMPKIYAFQGSENVFTTPWQTMFNPLGNNFTYERAAEILACTNRPGKRPVVPPAGKSKGGNFTGEECPAYFHLIRKDLAPWREKGIMRANIDRARGNAAFKLTALGGKLYIERYRVCFQTRGLFTMWGMLIFMEKYHGRVPDAEMMFWCGDRPQLGRAQHAADPEGPPVLFGYDSGSNFFDIPFPDWSFWGWSELRIASWDEEWAKIVEGSRREEWASKAPRAFWTGNPYVGALHRVELLKCNNAVKAEIQGIDWAHELARDKANSKLEDQCKRRYMIYTEGNGWSVSLKYILACGSPMLVIAPGLYDFFSRGLQEWVDYIPVRPPVLRAPELCRELDKGVEYGQANETRAVEIGRAGLDYMRNNVSMEHVYSYMFHLVSEYAKLQKFEPSVPPEGAHLLTLDHLLCIAGPNDKPFLSQAAKVMPPNRLPCYLPDPPAGDAAAEFQGFNWEAGTPG